MGGTRLQHLVHARQRDLRRALASELRRVIETEGMSLRALGAAVGVDPSHLSRVLGEASAISHDTLVAVATGLGYDVSIRLFESVGPRVRDRIQVRMIEALLAALHRRWLARLEVGVYRPVRGVIDVVLQDRETWDVVAGEAWSSSCAGPGRRPMRCRPPRAGRGPTGPTTQRSGGCSCSGPATPTIG